jgi:hypothetical protein
MGPASGPRGGVAACTTVGKGHGEALRSCDMSAGRAAAAPPARARRRRARSAGRAPGAPRRAGARDAARMLLSCTGGRQACRRSLLPCLWADWPRPPRRAEALRSCCAALEHARAGRSARLRGCAARPASLLRRGMRGLLEVAPRRAVPAPARHLEAVPADDAVDGRELGRLGRQRGHALPRCAAGPRGPRQRPHSKVRLSSHATKRACMAMAGRSRRPRRARTEGAVHRDNETGTVQGPASAGALASPAGQPPAPRTSAGTITRAEPARAAQAPDARAGPAPA